MGSRVKRGTGKSKWISSSRLPNYSPTNTNFHYSCTIDHSYHSLPYTHLLFESKESMHRRLYDVLPAIKFYAHVIVKSLISS